ncbi:MAG: potassium channel family protein [Ilumatobacteraceae bacterium]|jgi:hypothetical protein
MEPDSAALRAQRAQFVKIVGLALGLLLVYACIPLQDQWWWIGMLVGIAALVAMTPFAVRRAAAVATAPNPVFAAAQALTIVVAMLVFGFSGVYLAIDRHHDQFVGLQGKVDAVYFTVTTLSTVGYGDVHAVGRTARIIVTLQILVDLSLFAVVVRMLVGAARSRRQS